MIVHQQFVPQTSENKRKSVNFVFKTLFKKKNTEQIKEICCQNSWAFLHKYACVLFSIFVDLAE